MNKQQLITLAMGSAFAAVAALPAQAAGNPFAAKTLDAGYQVAQADMKAKDGKCGASKKTEKAAEGKCSADKAHEGKCGGEKATEGKCSADKAHEGKCGSEEKK